MSNEFKEDKVSQGVKIDSISKRLVNALWEGNQQDIQKYKLEMQTVLSTLPVTTNNLPEKI